MQKVFYSLDGIIHKVKDCPNSRAALAALAAFPAEIATIHNEGGQYTVEIEGGGEFTPDECVRLNELIGEVGLYTSRPAIIHYEYNDEFGRFIVGDDDHKAEAASKARVQAAQAALDALTDAERDEIFLGYHSPVSALANSVSMN
jgi:hypothetical protein